MHTQHFRGWLVIEETGDVDLATAPQLRQFVLQQLSEGHRMLAIDLSFADFIDSIGLGILVAVLKRVRVHDGELVVVCPEPRLRRVFELTDLVSALGVCDSRADLVAVV